MSKGLIKPEPRFSQILLLLLRAFVKVSEVNNPQWCHQIAQATCISGSNGNFKTVDGEATGGNRPERLVRVCYFSKFKPTLPHLVTQCDAVTRQVTCHTRYCRPRLTVLVQFNLAHRHYCCHRGQDPPPPAFGMGPHSYLPEPRPRGLEADKCPC